MNPHLAALRADIRRTYHNYASGGRLKRLSSCARMPGVQAVTVYRFGQWLTTQKRIVRFFLESDYVLLQTMIKILWGIELPRDAQIGPGLYIGHFGGITISPGTVIGSNCNLSQNVTIGTSGSGAKAGVPVIGDDVYIAPGARLFGKIRIGRNCKIGANAVVHRDVPDNAIVVMDPGFKILSFKGNRSPPAHDIAA